MAISSSTTMIPDDSLYLYNLTLRHATPGLHTCLGQFTGATKKAQELVIAHNTTLQIYSPDLNTGKLATVGKAHECVFATIARIDKIRAVGQSRDLLVITGDSGKLSILEFNRQTLQFQPVLQQTYGKSGQNRLSQGSYLAIDPQGRAICLSALEKNKLIYKIQASPRGLLEVSAPLEASSKNVLTLSITALDTEFDNPVFAAIECDHSEYSAKKAYDPQSSPLHLNYYELDQGLNHVVKKKASMSLPASATHLVPLPGHIRGVLVCCDSYLIYANPTKATRAYIPLPTRQGATSTVITLHVTHRLKKNDFFVLLQSTLGDLFKVTVDYDDDREVIDDIKVSYFDTIPACTSLNVFKSGFLFANVINNDKQFYQFEKLGDDVDESSIFHQVHAMDEIPDPTSHQFQRKPLENLALIDSLDNLCPIIQAEMIQTTHSSTTPINQLVTLSSSCYLKTLTHGIPTNLLVSSPLPMTPNQIYTTKLTRDAANDAYLVLSSLQDSKTLVLSIGEVVEEVEDSLFVIDQATLAVQQVGNSSVVQVYSNGIKHIRQGTDGSKTTSDWFPPAGIQISHTSTNNEQVVIGLSNGEICYFEVDPHDDQLVEYQERLEVTSPITSLAIASSSNEFRKSSFAVVGCLDETIQVVSLQVHNCLEIVSLQALSSRSVSLVMLRSGPHSTYVHIGMENGVYVRTTIDPITGTLSDTRIKYLGTKPVQLSTINNASSLLAVSSSPWVGYQASGDFKLSPLLNIGISTGSSFISEDIGGEGIVGLSGNELVIFSIGDEESGFDPSQDFNVEKLRLRYFPRRMIVDRDEKIKNVSIYVAQSEYGRKERFGEAESEQQEEQENSEQPEDLEVTEATESSKSSKSLKSEETDNPDDPENPDEQQHSPQTGSWASCIQVVDYTSSHHIVQTVELASTDSILSMEKLHFTGSPKGNEFLVVGITTNQRFLPNSHDNSYLYVYRILKKKGLPNKLRFLHKTEVEDAPNALLAFNGKLLVGLGSHLRLYDLGQKQLLRKSSTKLEYITSIQKLMSQGNNRIVLTDARLSTTFAKYDASENRFVVFVDDVMKRQATAIQTLDYDTIVGGDKYCNIWVSRVPRDVSARSDNDWTLVKGQDGFLSGAPARLTNQCEFHVGDIATSFIKGSLVVGGHESVFYTGLQGTIGVLMPLATKPEVELMAKLEDQLRKHFDYNFNPDMEPDHAGYNLLGKDHLKFRGYYNPVKNVIDGDMVEKYYELNGAARVKIAAALDRTPKEIERKIFDLRNRSAF
ncbi:uncharacterized protein CANTADRAFT_27538 [Suhomyces tanzawaensis NRRL Y-17324]|uniref:Pre-mRNA-splicing factor RSE1 n=1 Tax=Suhomyces tanzawaensis NRRL Y-17324 TaxID=984487 RepID=A0A1E4SB90_9ASCO|nr:uncharacterized protein CANTADRAFT_27538 [Suhomyces tanzawaensis NRRL Y-17324]ODV76761.1 hypothetical protein CANTADRAFT_27538 [Suhomyces tanzawaensis NRRL Y-17324]